MGVFLAILTDIEQAVIYGFLFEVPGHNKKKRGGRRVRRRRRQETTREGPQEKGQELTLREDRASLALGSTQRKEIL